MCNMLQIKHYLLWNSHKSKVPTNPKCVSVFCILLNIEKYYIILKNKWKSPCKKCAMDSHGNSMSFLVTNRLGLVAVWSKFTLNYMTIPCHLSRFCLLSMYKHDMDFGQVQVMEFSWYLLRKWWDFRRIWCHFPSNCCEKAFLFNDDDWWWLPESWGWDCTSIKLTRRSLMWIPS